MFRNYSSYKVPDVDLKIDRVKSNNPNNFVISETYYRNFDIISVCTRGSNTLEAIEIYVKEVIQY